MQSAAPEGVNHFYVTEALGPFHLVTGELDAVGLERNFDFRRARPRTRYEDVPFPWDEFLTWEEWLNERLGGLAMDQSARDPRRVALELSGVHREEATNVRRSLSAGTATGVGPRTGVEGARVVRSAQRAESVGVGILSR